MSESKIEIESNIILYLGKLLIVCIVTIKALFVFLPLRFNWMEYSQQTQPHIHTMHILFPVERACIFFTVLIFSCSFSFTHRCIGVCEVHFKNYFHWIEYKEGNCLCNDSRIPLHLSLLSSRALSHPDWFPLRFGEPFTGAGERERERKTNWSVAPKIQIRFPVTESNYGDNSIDIYLNWFV